MTPKELNRRLGTREKPFVLDVRSGFEFAAGHIPGAVHVPFWMVLFSGRLPADRAAPIVVTCEHGPRALLAALFLSLRGYRSVEMLEGHMAGWKRGGLPLSRQ